MKPRYLSLLALLLVTPAYAEEVEKPYGKNDKRDIWSITSENDLYGGGSDRNYTNGLRVSRMVVDPDVPNWFYKLANETRVFDFGETTALLYSIGQNMYTPRDITIEANQPDDRPWAGFLYGSMALISGDEHHVDTLEATVGVVGPSAMAKNAQRFIHSHISDSPDPRGWRNQLKDEPALMLSWERRFPTYFRYKVPNPIFPIYTAWTPYVTASLGNVYTLAGAGAQVRIGYDDGTLQDFPMRVRPSLPGSGYYDTPNGLNGFVFAGVEGRAVAHNIFLDGNTFRDSDSVDKKYWVYDLQAGAAISYREWRMAYTLVYRSEEFRGQDGGDVFGAINISTKF